ncbi:unnamed protein product, partial [Rotaria sp. Silwood1]
MEAFNITSISVELKFDDGNSSELVLTTCKKTTNSSLNSLLRSRRAPPSATTN